jgi:Zn-dependent protease
MIKFRRFLCACFGNIALLFLLVSFSTLPRVFHLPQASGVPYPDQPLDEKIILITLLAQILARLIFLQPVLVSFLYGMAWWKVKQGKPSGRGWAIAASILMIFQGVPPILIALRYSHQMSGLALQGFIAIFAILLIIGVPGLVAFLPRNSMAEGIGQTAPLPRISGDGTSKLLDAIAWLVQIAGYIWGMSLWNKWAWNQGLSRSYGLLDFSAFVLAVLVTIVVHELGHAGVGRALGMRLRSFIIGPFQWRVSEGRWEFKFTLSQILSARGGAGVVPSRPEQNRWEEICMIAAGPAVNLVVGVIAACAALTAQGQPWERWWHFLALLATISFITFLGNLVPFRPEGSYSDGARIYQLLRGGPLVDLHRAFNLAGATHVTAIRPRDYDAGALQRAGEHFKHGQQALVLRLIESEHYLDSGEFDKCCEVLDEGELIYHESASDIPAGSLTVFIIGYGLVRRDVAKARFWWDRREAKGDSERGVNHWMSQSVLFWLEGQPAQANEAWDKANALAQKARPSGSDAFDSYRIELLRGLLKEVPVAEEMAC